MLFCRDNLINYYIFSLFIILKSPLSKYNKISTIFKNNSLHHTQKYENSTNFSMNFNSIKHQKSINQTTKRNQTQQTSNTTETPTNNNPRKRNDNASIGAANYFSAPRLIKPTNQSNIRRRDQIMS